MQAELREQLTELKREHNYDRDGGYGLVKAINRYWDELGLEADSELSSLLLQMVADREPTWWGIAIEVLAERGSAKEANALLDMLGNGWGTTEWENEIVRVALEIGDLQVLERCLPRVDEALKHQQRCFLIFLMRLFRLDSDLATRWGAEFLGKALSSPEGENEIRNYIPGLAKAMIKEDPALPSKLQTAIRLINEISSRRFASLIRDYLHLPWALEGLRRSNVERVLMSLIDA